ncbi:MAG: cytochrome c4 [Proteobacteria bacterium]|nr:cytochrome c4 [Pseudomonadota bacterium]
MQLLVLGLSAARAADAPLVGNAEAGATKIVTCSACHGPTGNSPNPEWPNLAGQHHEYIAEQLALLKSGARIAPVMNPMAATLSPQDMADVAAYFEKQTLTGLEADAKLAEAGEKLYRGGDAARGIPACLACHGPNGRGNGPARWPQIRAQQPTYVSNQLHAYAAKTRYAAGATLPPGVDMMTDVASRLSEDDIKSLTAYLQGLR